MWTVTWMDQEGNRQAREFHYSTAAVRFVCEVLEKEPATDIILEDSARGESAIGPENKRG